MEVCHGNHEQQTDFREENLVHRDTCKVEWTQKHSNSNKYMHQEDSDDELQNCELATTSDDLQSVLLL